jgi:hypothetical protein
LRTSTYPASSSTRDCFDSTESLIPAASRSAANSTQPISAAFLFPAAELAEGDQAAAARLVSAIVATAHGHAMLMLDGTFGSGQQAADAAARQAATATLALITGRQALM